MEFRKFDKIPRLNRGMVITEKIDGTNGCVVVSRPEPEDYDKELENATATADHERIVIHVQSRKRIITPGKDTDNFGFAGWVREHAEELAWLGEGRHYGEWWGGGIQRGYGLQAGGEPDRRFSLFNTGRWSEGVDVPSDPRPPCCSVVPVIKRYDFSVEIIDQSLAWLRENGSMAAPGFDNPEGIVIYHAAARQMFKVTLEGDESPKGIYKGMHANA
jgi:hypothetical protein